MKDALGTKRCATCCAYNQPVKDRMGICVRNPPTPLFMGMMPQAPPVIANPTKTPQQVLMPMVQTAYPECHPDSGCHQWAPIPPGIDSLN